MTCDQVLAELARLRCRVEVDAEGWPHLKGQVKALGKDLIAEVRRHREEIIRRLTGRASNPDKPRLREFRWGNGMVYPELIPWGPDVLPAAATHWRYVGDEVWIFIDRGKVAA